jgi:5-methylcytosine-specific restriction endonuclease McrA
VRIFWREPRSETASHKKTMRQFPQKRRRLKLSAEEYGLLRKQALQRDAWRCQICGSPKDLQVHHLTKRSRLGDDVLDNLITLCAPCHDLQYHCPSGST